MFSYARESGRLYPQGIDQLVITVPLGVTLGCAVPVIGVSGNVLTNVVTLPIAQNGGTCTDPSFGIVYDVFRSLAGKAAVNYSYLSVSQSTVPVSGTANASGTVTVTQPPLASAEFLQVPGSELYPPPVTGGAIGNCVIFPPRPLASSSSLAIPPKGLDAGSMTLNGPSGVVNLQRLSLAGFYTAPLANSDVSSNSVITFAATGGNDIGAFSTEVSFPVPLTWTNMSSITSINRSQGVTVTWTGGAPGTYVQISGSSKYQLVTIDFTCTAPLRNSLCRPLSCSHFPPEAAV